MKVGGFVRVGREILRASGTAQEIGIRKVGRK